jgi:MoxR-like ATPase
MLSGPKMGSVYSLEVARTKIGKAEDCDLILDEDSLVSGHHAEIIWNGSEWLVADLGSTNGTFLNSSQIQEKVLQLGDVLLIGESSISFEENQLSDSTEVEETPLAVESPVTENPEVKVKVAEMSVKTRRIAAEIGKAIIGQDQIVLDLLTAIISNGHVLMIGMPGLAKTMMVRTVSEVLHLNFKRIQFTPDLMPSDITGTDIIEVDEATGRKEYRFIKGPIFTNILLADEINRTPPKTQAALLEAMQEHRVTAAGETHHLDLPFFVLATQNPLEQEGTYPLPEAQLDRFMFSIMVDYPSEKDEETIARETTKSKKVTLNKILDGAEILELQKVVKDLPVSDHVIKYAVRLVRSTRPTDARAPDFIKKWIHCGAGPRATQFLITGAKARAVIDGRLLVSTDDVRSVAAPILRHRMITNFTADSEGMDSDKIAKMLIEAVAEPDAKDY